MKNKKISLIILFCLISIVIFVGTSYGDFIFSGITITENEEGVAISKIEHDAFTDSIKLKKGDIILKVDGEKIVNIRDYAREIRKISNGKKLHLVVKRGNNTFDATRSPNNAPNETNLDDVESSIKHTPIPEADAYCLSGMLFVKKGFHNEAMSNFRLATRLYKKAFNEVAMSKEELIAVRENLNKINEQLNVFDIKTGDTGKDLTAFESHDYGLAIDKSSNHTEIKDPNKLLQYNPIEYARKENFKDAEKGEYWIIESTTMLLKKPELPDNSTQLLRSLISGIKPGTVVIISESKGTDTKWVKVRTIDNSDATYVEGWILSDTVKKARQIIKR